MHSAPKSLNLIEKCQIMPKLRLRKNSTNKGYQFKKKIDQLKPVIFIHVPLNNTKY